MRLDSCLKKILLFFLIMVLNISAFANWGTYLTVTRVQDDYTYPNYKSKAYVAMRNHDLIAFEIEATYNIDGDFDSDIWLTNVTDNASIIFENWEDQFGVFAAGERQKSFKRLLYVRPESETGEPYTVSFKIQSGWREQNNLGGPGNISGFEVYVTVLPTEAYEVTTGDSLPLPLPTVQPEPDFTSGSSNSVYWNPITLSNLYTNTNLVAQDLYFFDAENMDEMEPAVKGLFKANSSADREVWFQGLEDGHTYGYIAKAVYIVGSDTINQYSNVVFSTQDNSPPEAVLRPRVSTENNQVELIWGSVDDAVSDVRSYAIFRAEDTQVAVWVDSVVAEPPETTYTWVDPKTVSGIEYNYRVRAIDLVGNMGEGDRSNSVVFDGSGSGWTTINPPDVTPDIPTDTAFLKGPVDRLAFVIEGQEDQIRFEVARDDTAYFHSTTGAGHRYFDSGWLALTDTLTNEQFSNDPSNNDRVFFEFDYGDGIDLNFVNGHTYYRKITRKIAHATYTTYLESMIPDCFPPDDIRNFLGETILDASSDPLNWKVNLSWQATVDHISGVKQYVLYRKIQGLDEDYRAIEAFESGSNSFAYLDQIVTLPDSIRNATLSYRVVAQDAVGNIRSVESANWQVDEIALASPELVFTNLEEGRDITKGNDTLFTKNDGIVLEIQNFDLTKATHYIVLVNGTEETHRNRQQDTLRIDLPEDEIAHIQVRAVYTGQRFSLYSNTKVVARTRSLVPQSFTVHNDTSFWGGHLYLNWERPSIDVSKYEIWRSSGATYAVIGTLADTSQSLSWTDFYQIDENTNRSTDPLTNYQTYSYKVRKQNVFGDWTDFSAAMQDYVNHPPEITRHDRPKISEDGEKALTIYWNRVYPTIGTLGQKTYVYVYQDTFDVGDLSRGLVNTAIVANDDSAYTYHDAVPGHNYIFRIKEVPNELQGKKSAWSEPYTITLQILEPMYLVPQPKGGMYLRWENPEIMSRYSVEAIKVFIAGPSSVDSLVFPASVIDYMTSPGILEHGNVYQYSVFALDSLGQVVADNALTDTCDTGAVYIPEITPFYKRYYSGDSVTVNWAWKNVDGQAIDYSSRGAVSATLQASVSKSFPSDITQTVAVGPFAVDSSITQKTIAIPPLGNRENGKLFFKITAKDAWGNPSEALWSTDFYEMKTAIYDPVPPRKVTDQAVARVLADPTSSDTILVSLTWTGKGVEWPVNGDEEQWDQMIGNVSSYRILRLLDDQTVITGEVLVQSDSMAYTFVDRAPNRVHQWQIVSIDSAGHQTSGQTIASPVFLQTPDSPLATDFRACQTESYHNASGAVDYFFEIAVASGHFKLAYQMDDSTTIDRLLSRSGWMGETEYTANPSWGAVVHDTTWFRLKVRQWVDDQYWESGWSSLSTYPNAPNGTEKQANAELSIVRTFQVSPNYPNPFNCETVISYQIPEQSKVSVVLYNVKGEVINRLFDGEQSFGQYQFTWDGKNQNGKTVASGIYFLHVLSESQTGAIHQKRMKMTLIK